MYVTSIFIDNHDRESAPNRLKRLSIQQALSDPKKHIEIAKNMIEPLRDTPAYISRPEGCMAIWSEYPHRTVTLTDAPKHSMLIWNEQKK